MEAINNNNNGDNEMNAVFKKTQDKDLHESYIVPGSLVLEYTQVQGVCQVETFFNLKPDLINFSNILFNLFLKYKENKTLAGI